MSNLTMFIGLVVGVITIVSILYLFFNEPCGKGLKAFIIDRIKLSNGTMCFQCFSQTSGENRIVAGKYFIRDTKNDVWVVCK